MLVLLALAGMLRPEAWVLAGLYWLWVAWRATWRQRALYAALAALGPLVWTATDFIVTGDPLFSLLYTSGSAEDLGRQRTLAELPTAIPGFLNLIVKLPILLAAAGGLLLAVALAPRRAAVPLALFVSGVGTFVLIGVAGASVIERYLAIAAVALLVFAGVFLGGFTMLRPGRAAHVVDGRRGGARDLRRRVHGHAGPARLLRLRAEPSAAPRTTTSCACSSRPPCRRGCAAARSPCPTTSWCPTRAGSSARPPTA